jgi:iron(III) transport system substrate-binding protein
MARILMSLLVLVASFLWSGSAALAQNAALIDAAKKEGGKVSVYGSLEAETVDTIKKAFEKRTGLQMDYWRASSTKVMDRALSEHRAGRPLFDVFLTNRAPMQILQTEGVFAKYDSPSFKGFPRDAFDPNLGPAYRYTVVGILFNSTQVKAGDAPKSLEDLLNPKYKGKVVMPDPTQHTTTAAWLANLHKVMGGKERADKYIRDLAATKPLLVESLLPAARRVTTGETPIAISYVKYAYVFPKREGAPVDYVRLPQMLGESHLIGLAVKAPHTSAGKAFIDFFLGQESMKIMAEEGEFVNLEGIYPPLPGAEKIKRLGMDEFSTEEFKKLRDDYKRIFFGS